MIDAVRPFEPCRRCGQPTTGALPDGWYGWCTVCQEAWFRWWNNPNTRPTGPRGKLIFGPESRAEHRKAGDRPKRRGKRSP